MTRELVLAEAELQGQLVREEQMRGERERERESAEAEIAGNLL
jgi:hypothetical protein